MRDRTFVRDASYRTERNPLGGVEYAGVRPVETVVDELTKFPGFRGKVMRIQAFIFINFSFCCALL